MNAADTSASSAIADCTPLAVVCRSCTTAEIDTFMIDVSTTSTNIAIASSRASLLEPVAGVLDPLLTAATLQAFRASEGNPPAASPAPGCEEWGPGRFHGPAGPV